MCLYRCDTKQKFRSISGICNNLAHSSWGSTSSRLRRLLPPAYADFLSIPRGGVMSARARRCHRSGNRLGKRDEVFRRQKQPNKSRPWKRFFEHYGVTIRRSRGGDETCDSCITEPGDLLPNPRYYWHCRDV